MLSSARNKPKCYLERMPDPIPIIARANSPTKRKNRKIASLGELLDDLNRQSIQEL